MPPCLHGEWSVADGIEATRRLQEFPSPSRVVVLTTFDLGELVYATLRPKRAGLLKDAPAVQLSAAIRTIAQGDALLAPAITKRLMTSLLTAHPPRADAARPPEGWPRAGSAQTNACGPRRDVVPMDSGLPTHALGTSRPSRWLKRVITGPRNGGPAGLPSARKTHHRGGASDPHESPMIPTRRRPTDGQEAHVWPSVAAVAGAGALMIAAPSAASAQPAKAHEHFTIIFKGSGDVPGTIIASGQFNAVGRVTHIPDSDDSTAVFPGLGTFVIHLTDTGGTDSFNELTCVEQFTFTDTQTFSDGTGRFAGISGTGSSSGRGTFVARRTPTGCNRDDSVGVVVVQGDADLTLPTTTGG